MKLRYRFDRVTQSNRAHIQAAHVNPDSAVVGLLLVLSDLVQQVEVGPGVLQRRESVCYLFVGFCAFRECALRRTLMSSLKFRMVCVPAFCR